jgi:hypothetical protein
VKAVVSFILGVAGLIALTAFSGLVSDEVRGQLDRIPYAVLRLARRRVPQELRVSLHDEEWQPELHNILNRAEGRPISRLVTGTLFALGILRTARRISRNREKLVAPEIELRRLISLGVAVDALGNIITAVVGYALILTLGFAASVGVATGLRLNFPHGNVNAILWWSSKSELFLVFGSGLG